MSDKLEDAKKWTHATTKSENMHNYNINNIIMLLLSCHEPEIVLGQEYKIPGNFFHCYCIYMD